MPHAPTADKPSLLATSDIFSSFSSVRPVTPEPWQHSPVDLLFHETPSCSLLSCNQICLLGKHAGSRQEEEYCLCALSPLSSSCVSPAEVRWVWSTILPLMWPRVTEKELSVTAADTSPPLWLTQHLLLHMVQSCSLNFVVIFHRLHAQKTAVQIRLCRDGIARIA